MEVKQIFDAVLIANETIESRLKSSINGIICKMHIEKAYDHVKWDSLMTILEKMGFSKRWIKKIKQYISTTRFSKLVNGTLMDFFKNSQGMRQ